MRRELYQKQKIQHTHNIFRFSKQTHYFDIVILLLHCARRRCNTLVGNNNRAYLFTKIKLQYQNNENRRWMKAEERKD